MTPEEEIKIIVNMGAMGRVRGNVVKISPVKMENLPIFERKLIDETLFRCWKCGNLVQLRCKDCIGEHEHNIQAFGEWCPHQLEWLAKAKEQTA